MAVIQADFAPAQPAFDYPRFRAEFVRRKRLSRFQRVLEDAAAVTAGKRTATPEPTENGTPYWADYQIAPGIMNTAHQWQSERYHDPDTGRIRYTPGALEQVRNIYSSIEPDAIANIEGAALTWTAARGRTTLTPDEHRILALSKRYLTECDTRRFKEKYPRYAPHYRSNGTLIEKIMFSWISWTTGFGVKHIEGLLIAVENVYALRAILGLENAPEVRVNIRRLARADGDLAA